jgi:hypothetical protein
MDTDELIEKLDEEGLTEELEDEVVDNADELVDRLDELDDDIVEIVIDNV